MSEDGQRRKKVPLEELDSTYRSLADLFDPQWRTWPGGQKGEVMAELEIKDANDRIYNVLWGAGMLDGAFLCECSNAHCVEEVPMKLAEYLRLRDREGALFAPDHGGL